MKIVAFLVTRKVRKNKNSIFFHLYGQKWWSACLVNHPVRFECRLIHITIKQFELVHPPLRQRSFNVVFISRIVLRREISVSWRNRANSRHTPRSIIHDDDGQKHERRSTAASHSNAFFRTQRKPTGNAFVVKA